jgi:DNA-directed RNA polymerase specialized sigma subunit
LSDDYDTIDTEYDYERDEKIDKAYDEVKEELSNMKKRKGFASAMIYEHYWFSEKTLDEVSKDIKISKSTVFLAVKKVKKHLKQNIQNPFNNE